MAAPRSNTSAATARLLRERRRALRYLQDAADLRIAIEYNLHDSRLADEGGRIVYLVDANVVALFLAPAKEVRHVAPFAADTGRHLVATAAVTAEYLFSRKLPGQQGAPMLIAPGHGDDLGYVIDKLGHASNVTMDEGEAPTLSEAARKEVRSLLVSFRDAATDRDEACSVLRQRLPELAAEIGAFGLTKQLHRLYEDDMLRPLALHPHASAEVLEPDNRKLKRWTDLLRRGRPRTTDHLNREASVTSTEIRHRKDERDAAAILQTELLNKQAVEEGSRRRYVLVTGDKVIHRVYATWFWSADNPHQEPHYYCLRQPLQYLPVLNMADMPNRIRASLIHTTREALDTLLSNIRYIDDRYPYTLPYHSARIASKRNSPPEPDDIMTLMFGVDPYPTSIDRKALETTIDSWRQCFGDSVVQNAGLLRRRADAEFTQLIDLIDREPDLRMAILREQRRLLQQVEAAHLALGTHMNLQVMPRVGKQAARGPGRGPVSIRVDFSDIVGSNGKVDVASALDALVEDPGELARIGRRLLQPQDYKAAFFSACVAFRCALWHATRQHIHRALRFLPAAKELPLRQEMRHLLAVAIRFSLRTVDDFAEADAILMEAIEHFRSADDPLGEARALSERATLHLSTITQSIMMPETTIPNLRTTSDHDFSSMGALLDKAAKDLRCRTGGEWYGAWRIVRMQLVANVIANELLQRLSIAKLAPIPAQLLAMARATLEEEVESGTFPKVFGLELRMLTWSDIDDLELRAKEGARIAEDCRQLAADPSAGELTELDRVELKTFADILGPVQIAAGG